MQRSKVATRAHIGIAWVYAHAHMLVLMPLAEPDKWVGLACMVRGMHTIALHVYACMPLWFECTMLAS